MILLAWEYEHLPPLVEQLIGSYDGTVPTPNLILSDDDNDTIWTIRLDSLGNLMVDNILCDGIDSFKLPTADPGETGDLWHLSMRKKSAAL